MKNFNKGMTRWYGHNWLRDSLVLLTCLVIIPVLIGSLG